MRRNAVAVAVLALVAAVSCQTGAVLWSACRPAANGDPFGVAGNYVVACKDGRWVPLMTIEEYLALRQGQAVTIGSVPQKPPAPKSTTTTTPEPTTTTTTTPEPTTTTTTTTSVPGGGDPCRGVKPVVIGDSVGAGAGATAGWPDVAPLAGSLTNVSVGGRYVGQAYAEAFEAIDSDPCVERIIVMLGLNDAAAQYTYYPLAVVDTLTPAKAAVTRLHDDLAAAGVDATFIGESYVAQERDKGSLINAWMSAFNGWLSSTYGAVDCGLALGNPLPISLTIDGTHPNDAGQALLASCADGVI